MDRQEIAFVGFAPLVNQRRPSTRSKSQYDGMPKLLCDWGVCPLRSMLASYSPYARRAPEVSPAARARLIASSWLLAILSPPKGESVDVALTNKRWCRRSRSRMYHGRHCPFLSTSDSALVWIAEHHPISFPLGREILYKLKPLDTRA